MAIKWTKGLAAKMEEEILSMTAHQFLEQHMNTTVHSGHDLFPKEMDLSMVETSPGQFQILPTKKTHTPSEISLGNLLPAWPFDTISKPKSWENTPVQYKSPITTTTVMMQLGVDKFIDSPGPEFLPVELCTEINQRDHGEIHGEVIWRHPDTDIDYNLKNLTFTIYCKWCHDSFSFSSFALHDSKETVPWTVQNALSHREEEMVEALMKNFAESRRIKALQAGISSFFGVPINELSYQALRELETSMIENPGFNFAGLDEKAKKFTVFGTESVQKFGKLSQTAKSPLKGSLDDLSKAIQSIEKSGLNSALKKLTKINSVLGVDAAALQDMGVLGTFQGGQLTYSHNLNDGGKTPIGHPYSKYKVKKIAIAEKVNYTPLQGVLAQQEQLTNYFYSVYEYDCSPGDFLHLWTMTLKEAFDVFGKNKFQSVMGFPGASALTPFAIINGVIFHEQYLHNAHPSVQQSAFLNQDGMYGHCMNKPGPKALVIEDPGSGIIKHVPINTQEAKYLWDHHMIPHDLAGSKKAKNFYMEFMPFKNDLPDYEIK